MRKLINIINESKDSGFLDFRSTQDDGPADLDKSSLARKIANDLFRTLSVATEIGFSFSELQKEFGRPIKEILDRAAPGWNLRAESESLDLDEGKENFPPGTGTGS